MEFASPPPPILLLLLLLLQAQLQQSHRQGFREQLQQQLLARVRVVPHVSGHHHTNEMAGVACSAEQQLQLRVRQPGRVNGCSSGGRV